MAVITKKQIRSHFGGRTMKWLRAKVITDERLKNLGISPKEWAQWKTLPPEHTRSILELISELCGVEVTYQTLGRPVKYLS